MLEIKATAVMETVLAELMEMAIMATETAIAVMVIPVTTASETVTPPTPRQTTARTKAVSCSPSSARPAIRKVTSLA